jgi:hypothetical protein
MSIVVAQKTEARLHDEARRLGVSVDALLESLIDERETTVHAASAGSPPELPVLHLGELGSLRQRDLYDDVR